MFSNLNLKPPNLKPPGRSRAGVAGPRGPLLRAVHVPACAPCCGATYASAGSSGFPDSLRGREGYPIPGQHARQSSIRWKSYTGSHKSGQPPAYAGPDRRATARPRARDGHARGRAHGRTGHGRALYGRTDGRTRNPSAVEIRHPSADSKARYGRAGATHADSKAGEAAFLCGWIRKAPSDAASPVQYGCGDHALGLMGE